MKAFSLALLGTSLLVGCAAPRLPENVGVSSDGRYVERMAFNQATTLPTETVYGRMKTCIAEYISNEGVDLTDSAGSFVGLSGKHYQIDRARTTQGGSTIQAEDRGTKTIIAKGAVPYSGGAPIKLAHYLKFTVRAKATDGNIELLLSQITSAQESTGYATNRGFSPLGTWAGSTAGDAYSAAKSLSDQVFACVSQG